MDMMHLAGTRVAFVIKDDKIGPVHLLFGTELVIHTGLYLLTCGMVTLHKAAHPFFVIKINAHHFVDETVESVFVDYGALENDIGRIGMA